jgi:hypothetical protein
MKWTSLVAVAVMLALARESRADDDKAKACFDAAVKGQALRKEGKLDEARAAFVACARDACPAEVTGPCSTWILEVEAAMPSALVVVQDAQGHELSGARTVRVDGEVRDAAREIRVQPGKHTFALEVAGEAPVEEEITLREHERGRPVLLRLATKHVVETSPSSTKHASAAPWIFTTIALVAGASFGAFASAGVVDRSSSHCDVACAGSDASRVRAELLVADVSLGVAAVFGVVAIVDWIIVGSASAKRAAQSAFVVSF